MRESDALYHSLVENLPQYIFRKDKKGRYTFVNQQFCLKEGKPSEAFLGKTDLELYPPDMAQRFRKADQNIYETREDLEWIDVEEIPEGKKRYTQVIKTPIYDSKNHIVGIQGIFWDITEHKQAEEALNKSLQRLSLVVEQSPLAVIEWNTEFEVESWNSAAEMIFGYTAEEAIGRHAAGLIVPEELKSHIDQVWQKLLTQTGGQQSSNQNHTKDGRLIMCEWYNSPIVDAQGNVLCVASLVLDITERTRVEEELKIYQVMIESAQDAIFYKDLESRYISANDKTLEAFGLSREEVIGKNDYELMTDQEEARGNFVMTKLFLNQEKPQNFINR